MSGKVINTNDSDCTRWGWKQTGAVLTPQSTTAASLRLTLNLRGSFFGFSVSVQTNRICNTFWNITAGKKDLKAENTIFSCFCCFYLAPPSCTLGKHKEGPITERRSSFGLLVLINGAVQEASVVVHRRPVGGWQSLGLQDLLCHFLIYRVGCQHEQQALYGNVKTF